jgi:hypothetical protein
VSEVILYPPATLHFINISSLCPIIVPRARSLEWTHQEIM